MRNRKSRKWLLALTWLVVIFTGIFSVFVWYISQPLLFTSKTDVTVLVDQQKLHAHVRKLSVDFFPRSHSNIANLDKAAAYIKSELDKHSPRTRYQDFQVDGKRYRNVIATFGPDSGPRIIVGAHYDAVSSTPGADDNASGVSVLIELAALLVKSKPATRLDLIAYTLEEPPYFQTTNMGSYVHANDLKKKGVKIKLMISLEMLGYFTAKANSQRYPLSVLKYIYSDIGNFVAVVGKFGQASVTRKFKRYLSTNTATKVYSINAPQSLPGIDLSDHSSYWKFGYKAIMLTDTAFYRNHHYHQPEDTHEKLDYARMASITTGVYRALLKLAND